MYFYLVNKDIVIIVINIIIIDCSTFLNSHAAFKKYLAVELTAFPCA